MLREKIVGRQNGQEQGKMVILLIRHIKHPTLVQK